MWCTVSEHRVFNNYGNIRWKASEAVRTVILSVSLMTIVKK
jgi:hypothetical protein